MQYDIKNGREYLIIYPHVETSEQFDSSEFERVVQETVGEGRRAVVLSLRDIINDRSVCLGVIVICSQIVRKAEGYLVLVDTQNTFINALE